MTAATRHTSDNRGGHLPFDSIGAESKMWKKIADKAKSFYGGPGKEEQTETSQLEDIEPELMIKFLHQMPTVKLFNGLSRKLKASSSSDWMLEFLRLGGLSTLLEVLERLGEHKTKFTDAIVELQCVGCIRDVLGSEAGLGFMVDSESGLLRRLTQGEAALETRAQQLTYKHVAPASIFGTCGANYGSCTR